MVSIMNTIYFQIFFFMIMIFVDFDIGKLFLQASLLAHVIGCIEEIISIIYKP
jgi:hypothetical protein